MKGKGKRRRKKKSRWRIEKGRRYESMREEKSREGVEMVRDVEKKKRGE